MLREMLVLSKCISVNSNNKGFADKSHINYDDRYSKLRIDRFCNKSYSELLSI